MRLPRSDEDDGGDGDGTPVADGSVVRVRSKGAWAFRSSVTVDTSR